MVRKIKIKIIRIRKDVRDKLMKRGMEKKVIKKRRMRNNNKQKGVKMVGEM